MKNILKCFFVFFLFFIVLGFDSIKAKDITIDEVIDFMNNNNILEDNDYFYMFGKMLKGNEDYDVTDFSYVVSKNSNDINIKVTLTDNNSNKIENRLLFSVNGNVISYTNTNEVDSLESRIATVMLSQLIYSIGGARGYSKDLLIDWMNQIDLNTVTEEDGINWTYENVIYKISQNNRNYEYEVAVPKNFSVDINKITEKMPNGKKVSVNNIVSGTNSISMSILAPDHLDEMCIVYRRNDKSQYEKVGQVSCDNGFFIDENLKAETTYYYQVTIGDMIMCATDIEIATEKIPITGTFIGIGTCVVLTIIGVSCYMIYKKKSLFRKI